LKHGANLSATSSNYPPSVLLSSSVDKSRFLLWCKHFHQEMLILQGCALAFPDGLSLPAMKQILFLIHP